MENKSFKKTERVSKAGKVGLSMNDGFFEILSDKQAVCINNDMYKIESKDQIQELIKKLQDGEFDLDYSKRGRLKEELKKLL